MVGSALSPAPYDEKFSMGLMTVIPNSELERREKEEAERREEAEKEQASPGITSLASHIDICWSAARDAKRVIEDRMLECLRLRKGEYDSQTLSKIQEQGVATDFAKLTDVTCRGALGWFRDILLPAGEKPWDIDPTPVPDLPGDIQQTIITKVWEEYQMVIQSEGIDIALNIKWEEIIEQMKDEVFTRLKEQANEDAETIEREINDDLVEGNWYEALDDALDDFVTFPACILAGPTKRRKKVLEWENGIPTVVEKIINEYERKNPFDIYPSPGAKSIQDGYLIEKMPLRRTALNALIDVEGYNGDAIRLALNTFPNGYKLPIAHDTERSDLEGRPEEDKDPEGVIDTLLFWGPVKGSVLREWGMDAETIPDKDIDYDIKAYKIANIVIGAVLNPHPLGRRDYYTASFVKSNDSVWGEAIPELMKFVQNICNSCVRAMVNNMGIASGPQTWIDISRMAPGTKVTSQHPWKIWGFTKDEAGGTSGAPMGWFQPDSNVNELMGLYKALRDEASEVTGVPKYMYGSEKVGGAGRTASGLSMLMNAAAKGLKMAVGYVDRGFIKPSIQNHWLYIMLNEPEKAMGDINIVAKASEYLIIMEQLQIRRMEFLSATANEYDMGIIGIDGRAEVLREVTKSLKMNTDKIVPDSGSILKNQEWARIKMMIQNIAQATGFPVEQLMMLATNRSAGAEGGQAQNLNPDGSPQGGQDFNMMQGGQRG